jgi:hypothetical protein
MKQENTTVPVAAELMRLSSNILTVIGENENATAQAALKIASILYEHKSSVEYREYLSTLASRQPALAED